MKAAAHVIFATAAISLLSTALSPLSQAQESPTSQLLRSRTLVEAFDRAYFKNAKNFYDELSFLSQFTQFLNLWPPEHEIAWDAKRVNAIYQDALRQQGSSDPYLRVRDLPNPFCQTLQGTAGLCGTAPENPLPAAFQPVLPPPAPGVQTAPPTPALY